MLAIAGVHRSTCNFFEITEFSRESCSQLSGLPWGVQHRACREIIRIEVDAVLDG